MKMILKIWILFILIFKAYLAVEPGQGNLHKKVLKYLAEKFENIPKQKQYGVMYMHPPGTEIGTVLFVSGNPSGNLAKGSVIFPPFGEKNRDNFPFTYVATTPDYYGIIYGKMMNKQQGENIHTEDLMLNLVYNGMRKWYIGKFGEDVKHLYLYTYLLPCPSCKNVIQNFVNANANINLYVGFSNLLGGNKEFEEGISNVEQKKRIQDTKNRKEYLKNFLNDKNGQLFDLNANCYRRKRSTNEMCSLDESMTELAISMDFITGKAKANFLALPNNTNGWIGLYDQDNSEIERQNIASSTGSITFAAFMNENYSVKFWNDINLYMETGKWNQCGFDWIILNKVPCLYGTLLMRIQIQNGAPYVCLRHSGIWQPNANDWVMAQPLMNFTYNGKLSNWRPVSSFISAGQNTVCKKLAQLDTFFEEGFRVKYVYNNGTDQYEGPYDNSSPFWIPGECSVSRTRGNENHKSNPTSSAKRNGTTTWIVAILALIMYNANLINSYE